jgi:L-lactate dehydrogenase complex protein LldF
MTSEEIELNEVLEARGIDVVESDLGELIVQLAHEKPYHIVTPAMHKTRVEISELFQRELGSEPTHDPYALAAIARRHLRSVYTSADIGITGANFIVAGDGAIAITENEGNARLSVACPKVHIALVGIEKVIPRLSDLALFWPLLATSGTGQQVTCYSSIIRGPKAPGERDGPDEMIVILLDNGRSRLYADPKFRQALRCIRCGACLNACPVFRTVGGHSYATPYSGPIGSVITPQLRSLAGWQHLSFASSLCGACSDACPVGIDLHHLLLENRARASALGHTSLWWRLALVVWATVMVSRVCLGLARFCVRWLSRLLPFLVPASHKSVLAALPEATFRDWHRSRERSR